MKQQRTDIIDIPFDFKVACKLKVLKEHEVLQAFINHASLYMALSNDYVKGYREATNALSEYIFSRTTEPKDKVSFKNELKVIANIKGLMKLQIKQKAIEEKRHKDSLPLVRSILREININRSLKKLYLNEEQILYFTPDFSVLCETHRVYPKQFLEYFMNRISLADEYARETLRKYEHNAAMDFFLLLLKGFTNIIPEQRIFNKPAQDYVDGGQRLPYETFLIRDLDKRREIFKQFFEDTYYKMLNYNPLIDE